MSESGPPICVIAWSGGYDSTLILDRLCSAGDKNVWAYSLDWHMVNELKREQEKAARDSYREYAKRKGYIFCHETMTVTSTMSAFGDGLPQVLAWFNFVSPYLPAESELYFGYHRGDDFWMYQRFAENLMENAAALREMKVTIQYPLKLMRKCDVVEEVKKRGIPSRCVWSCENPAKRKGRIVACGNCVPCRTMKLAEYEGTTLRVLEAEHE